MKTFITDSVIATESNTCPCCGEVSTKTKDNDPLDAGKTKFKCNNPACGNTHTVHN